jgi:hypothetical protein
MKEEGGRFLKELEDGSWVEVDEAAARAKVVSHAAFGNRSKKSVSSDSQKGQTHEKCTFLPRKSISHGYFSKSHFLSAGRA